MARYSTIICDHCDREARLPATGWLATAVPKLVTTEPEESVVGDWCSVKCLTAHFETVAIQQPLAGLDDNAADVATSGAEAEAPRSLYQKDAP